jgi:hypothetical protein
VCAPSCQRPIREEDDGSSSSSSSHDSSPAERHGIREEASEQRLTSSSSSSTSGTGAAGERQEGRHVRTYVRSVAPTPMITRAVRLSAMVASTLPVPVVSIVALRCVASVRVVAFPPPFTAAAPTNGRRLPPPPPPPPPPPSRAPLLARGRGGRGRGRGSCWSFLAPRGVDVVVVVVVVVVVAALLLGQTTDTTVDKQRVSQPSAAASHHNMERKMERSDYCIADSKIKYCDTSTFRRSRDVTLATNRRLRMMMN